MRYVCTVAIATLSCLGAFCAPPTARAAFPGLNGRIVYSVNESRGDLDESWIEVLVRRERRTRRLDLHGSDPAFSPGGRRIAYSRLPGGNIATVSANGRGRSRRLTSAIQVDGSPDWSPSGRRKVFERFYSDGRPADLWIHYVRGNRRLTEGSDPAWSVKGDIAFNREIGSRPVEGIYVIRPDGSSLRQVNPRGISPDWSPRGRRIVVSSGSDIASMRADGSDFRRLTNGRAVDSQPAFSPNGKRIVFVRNGSNVMTMSSSGRRLKRVARAMSPVRDTEIEVQSVDWQPRPVVPPVVLEETEP